MISQNKGKQRDESSPKRTRYSRESSFSHKDEWYISHYNDDFYQSLPRRPLKPFMEKIT